ncbi:hypothetical protein [Curvivirga sp.]
MLKTVATTFALLVAVFATVALATNGAPFSSPTQETPVALAD